MKALLLTNEYPPHVYGGAGVHVDYLSRALAQLMDVEVRCFGDQQVEAGRLRVTGYPIDEPLVRRTDARLKSPLQALARCLRFTADPTDAAVVHCHTWYAQFGGILMKQAYGIPLVVTTHSLEPLRPWKSEQLGRGYVLSTWIERTALEMADGIIAVSGGMKQDILKFFDVDPERIHVVYNGIDTDEFHPVATTAALPRYGVDPARPYVLFVGRISRQKGILHLINAIQYLDAGVQVVLCAGAPDTPAIADEMGAAVRQVQQRRAGVVWIREMVDKPSLIELYSHAAVFCCPSIYEPFGIINLEAMACAVPVVASAVGGIKEVVVDGETGYLVALDQHDRSPFEPRFPDQFARDLAAPINRLCADASLRRGLGSAGRTRAVAHFSWRAIAQQTAAVYAQLLAGR